MRIGELAERAGTRTKALRFYEQAGLLPAPQRTRPGYRDYDQSALDRLRFIKAAQAAGLTLAESWKSSPPASTPGRRASTSRGSGRTRG